MVTKSSDVIIFAFQKLRTSVNFRNKNPLKTISSIIPTNKIVLSQSRKLILFVKLSFKITSLNIMKYAIKAKAIHPVHFSP